MPSIGQVARGASIPASIALKLAGLSNPVTAAIAGGLTLVELVDKIGQGRKAANKFTQNGGPQDIINKQLAAISGSTATAEEKSQATDKAWRDFLGAANDFASKNPKQANVVQQAIYKTPQLTQTVQSLLGKDPLDQSYASVAAPGIAAGGTQPNPGPSVGGTLLNAGIAGATPFVMSKLSGQGWNPSSTTTIGNVNARLNGSGAIDPTTGQRIATSVAAPGSSPGGGLGSRILTGVFGGGSQNNAGGAGNDGSLLSRILPSVISSGTSLLSGVLGSRAANNAANTLAGASTEAANATAAAGREATQFNREALAQQQANIQPWIDSGSGALRSIQAMLQDPTYQWNEKFTAPTADEALNDPGIQAQLKLGQRALEAYERANGTLISGKAIKDINSFAQDVASQGYDKVMQRQLSTYNTNYNTFGAERSARLNPLLAEAGLGQTSTEQLNTNIGQNANENANIGLTTAANVGNYTTGSANARASGYIGGANSWLNSLGQIGSNLVNTQTIAQMLSRLNPARAAA